MLTTTLIYAGVVPFTAALIVTLTVRWMGVSAPATWAWGTAFGTIAGQVALKRQLGVAGAVRLFTDPHEAVDWLPLIILIALGSSLLFVGASGGRRRFALLIAALVTIAVPLRLLGGNIRLDEVWNAFDKFVYAALLAGTLAIIWTSLGSASYGGLNAARLMLVMIVAIATAVVLTLSGVFIYGQLCGVVAASLAGTAVAFAGTRSSDPISRAGSGVWDGIYGAAGVITFSLGSLILLGRFFAELSTSNAILLLLALAAAGSPLPFAAFRQPGWRQLFARSVLCCVPLAVAISRVVGA